MSGRSMDDLKARLGLGKRPPNGGAPPAQEPAAAKPDGGPEPTEEQKATLIGLVVLGVLEEVRPWLKQAEETLPAVMQFIGEAAEIVRHAASEAETVTTTYGVELMRQRTANRKRQFDLYLESGFTREEAIQLMVAGFSQDISLGEKLISSIGDAALEALKARTTKA